MIEKLRADFVSAWVLAKHLPAIAAATGDELVRDVARAAHESYLYPVDSQVLTSAGELVDQVSANDHPDVARYLRLLEEAAQRER